MIFSARLASRLLLLVGLAGVLTPGTAYGQATTLGGEFRVNSNTNNNKDHPKIAVARGGTFQVVWQTQYPAADVYVRRFSAAGAPLGSDTFVNLQSIALNQELPAIASLNSNGAFVVVWRASYGVNGNAISAKLYDSTGAAFGGPIGGDEFRVDTYTSSGVNRDQPAVAADSSGNFLVAWIGPIQGSCCNGGIGGQRYDATGSPVGGNFAVHAHTTFGVSAQRPAIAFSGTGDFVVTWDEATGTPSGYDVFGQRFGSSGAPQGAVFQINTYSSYKQKDSSVAIDSTGNFVVVWDGGPYGAPVRGQRYSSSGATLGGEFQVSAGNDFEGSTSVAFLPGGFVVSWSDGANHDVQARLYAASGAPQGAEFRVNTYTTGNQYRASVGADTAGNFTVAWMSPYNTGIAIREIYAQRYCPALTNVSIALTSGSSNACPGQTAGTVTVTDAGGGSTSHQWGYRTAPAGAITSIAGQTGPTYVINTGDTLPSGTSYIVCTTIATCGGASLVSNNVTVFKGDVTGPVVTVPGAVTTRQTLCQ